MKYAVLLIASVGLTGCDITLGADGPVITQRDSIVSRVIPLGNRTPTTSTAATETTTVATVDTATPDATQTAPRAVREPISVSDILRSSVLPVGVTRNNVNAFKSAVTDAGCTISTVDQRNEVQNQTGFSDEKIDAIRDHLWRSDELELNSGNYQLTSGQCADV